MILISLAFHYKYSELESAIKDTKLLMIVVSNWDVAACGGRAIRVKCWRISVLEFVCEWPMYDGFTTAPSYGESGIMENLETDNGYHRDYPKWPPWYYHTTLLHTSNLCFLTHRHQGARATRSASRYWHRFCIQKDYEMKASNTWVSEWVSKWMWSPRIIWSVVFHFILTLSNLR